MTLNPDNAAPPSTPEPPSADPVRRWAFLSWIAAVLTLALLLWLSFPTLDQLARGIYTPTPAPPTLTPTPRPSRTPTITSTPTTEPTATLTPYPPSAYQIPDASLLDPALPGLRGTAVVINEDQAQVNPPFDNPQWISSDTIAQQLGKELTERYYATFGAASIQWQTDKPLNPGLYEVYVLDTVFSSGGSLDFTVSLGGQALSPIFGSTSLQYQSSRGNPPQIQDLWRSIGFYNLDRPDLLTIAASWQNRDENSIVAVDRVLIVPYPAAAQAMLERLPRRTQQTVLIDDLAARIESNQVIYSESDALSWKDQYQYVINPETEITATWETYEPVAAGKYEIFVWLPASHATGQVSYRVQINNEDVTPDGLESANISVNQSEFRGGQWVSLGQFTTPRIYEKPVPINIQIAIPANATGDIALDAVAIVRTE